MSEHQLRRILKLKRCINRGLSLLEIYPLKIYRNDAGDALDRNLSTGSRSWTRISPLRGAYF
ncbi:hypothetical protein ACEQPO_12055 [Bacillus sp. SL00103]